MEYLSFLSDYNILVLLTELLVIVGLAKLIAWPLGKLGFSALPAELLAGIVLGPTILGRFSPLFFSMIFPEDKLQHFMLDSIGWLGILFVLLTTGMEINLTSVWRQRKKVLIATTGSFVLPFLLAFPVTMLLPATFFPNPGYELAGRILIAVLLVVLAFPISLRIMGESGILRTDFGMLSAASFSLSDLIGWIMVMGILAIPGKGGANLLTIGQNSLMILLLLIIAFFIGSLLRKSFNAKPLKLRTNSPLGHEFTLMMLMGLGFGTASTLVGIHAFFGFFLGGLVLGASRLVRESSASTIGTFMETIFVPVFFASAGLRFDFVQNFNMGLFLLFAFFGFFLRFLGGYFASKVAGLPKAQQMLFAVLNSPAGELHVIASLIAWEAKLIDTQILVAIISGSLFSSIVAAPLATWFLKSSKIVPLSSYIAHEFMIPDLLGSKRDVVLAELCARAADYTGQHKEALLRLVMERENSISTALGRHLGFPHARLKGLSRPLIIIARSRKGIMDWEGPDGKKVRLVFLILSPVEQDDMQLQILRQLVACFRQEAIQERVLAADSIEGFKSVVLESLAESHLGLGKPVHQVQP